jgi:methionyl-tRNA formyltransferase
MAPRIAFFGTPEFAVPALAGLARAGHELLVVTQPARPQGRGLMAAASPIASQASALGLPLIERRTLRGTGDLDPMRDFAPDLLVVVAFGLILHRPLLELPRLGAVNLHPSLLPRHRGVAPIPWTLLAGDPMTGVATIRMDEGIDTGDLLGVVAVEVAPEENAIELGARLAQLGAELVVDTVDALVRETAVPRPQPSLGATYAPRLAKVHGHLEWTRPAEFLARQVRAMAGWPGARVGLDTEVMEIQTARALAGESAAEAPGRVMAVDPAGIQVATGSGRLLLTRVQAAGKRPLAAVDFARGRRLRPGACFASLPGADLLPRLVEEVFHGDGGWPGRSRAGAAGAREGESHGG